MKFKILSLILSSALALAACNNDAKDIEKSPKDETKQEQQTEKTDTKATDTNDKGDNTDEENDAKQEGESSVEEDDDVDNKDEATEADDDNDKNEASIKLDDIKVLPEDAIKTAQKKIPGDLESISFDNDMGQWVYAISLIDTNKKTHEIKVNAEQNKIISTQVEDDEDNVKTFDYGKFIPADKIIKAAQKVYNGDIKEWSLDHDDGKFKYNVELKGQDGKTKEFELDAKDMKILSKDA
ncbi:PepSY domain-containing protein [Macrococcoides caseolyticum]|uniref:PepSY domain-containing protein n=1 Tax=Macrococcoides caseolyticum TaxID=69966 RepID=UPI001F2B6013|nr:PepSY domain-containing protein [Macrococcus caseolyticus]MCE4957873.1 PepSY domain-containing protein [Macrococcus caseolyticus]